MENLTISEESEDIIRLKIKGLGEFSMPKKDFFNGVNAFKKLVRPVAKS